jgi:hypothetical protein
VVPGGSCVAARVTAAAGRFCRPHFHTTVIKLLCHSPEYELLVRVWRKLAVTSKFLIVVFIATLFGGKSWPDRTALY